MTIIALATMIPRAETMAVAGEAIKMITDGGAIAVLVLGVVGAVWLWRLERAERRELSSAQKQIQEYHFKEMLESDARHLRVEHDMLDNLRNNTEMLKSMCGVLDGNNETLKSNSDALKSNTETIRSLCERLAILGERVGRV